MSIVTLVSGGLDSTVMAFLARDERIRQYPLFIDYGQLGMRREFDACTRNFQKHDIPLPEVASLPGYGTLLSSGLTDKTKRIFEDAFLPCRNLMFLTVGAAYAYQCGASSVAIGLLSDSASLFPDQTRQFVSDASAILGQTLGRPIQIATPLMAFSKADIVAMAKNLGIEGTYSCHAGGAKPCGVCVACREYIGMES